MNPFFVSVIVTFFIFLSLQAPQRVQAWGRDGHQIIAAIAESRLTTITLLRVQSILRTTEPIASVSVWSDEVRPHGIMSISPSTPTSMTPPAAPMATASP
jgi:hypothetical protein